MGDFTAHQRKLINRYYDHRDEIALARLQEIVTELYLATTEKKVDQLWKQVEKAMAALKVSPKDAARILTERKPESLAESVKDWLGKTRTKP